MTPTHLLPPVAFVVVLAAVLLQSRLMDLLSLPPRPGAPQPGGKLKPYASGEDVPAAAHRPQPELGQFFHFAFFFTLVHVVALIVATVPRGSASAAALAAAFLGTAAVGLLVLLRR